MLNLKFINTYNTNPYGNLALEEYMLDNVGDDECILYLWQNRHTVVIGKNQNAYKECKISDLERDGGFLARRPSGGGAVYHDLGNLNFTFITTSGHYDVDKQLSVIVEAVNAYGICAEKTGRNDICIDGRKFSGNAFLKKGKRMYHHGTILVDVDMSQLSKYLNVSAEKLKAKGVASVRSRVVNLSELSKEVTVTHMRERLVKAFESVYGGIATEIKEEAMDNAQVKDLREIYESAGWKYGENMKADLELGDKFSWGEVNMQLTVKNNIIENVKIYTDSMDTSLPERLEPLFKGERFGKDVLLGKLRANSPDPVERDIFQLIDESEF